MTCNYKLGIPAKSQAECDQKAKALATLAEQLDGRTLSALAAKVPSILRDPIKSRIVKSHLGI